MAINNFVKRIQDVMRNDSGVNGDAQRIEQIVWVLFLKIYDAKEEMWEFHDDNYVSIIPEGLKWRDWAVDKKDGEALTGDALLDFVNNKLFPTLKNLEIDEETPMSQVIVRYAFEDANNYQKDGVLLRQVVNIIDEIDFTEYKERHEFGFIYESFLKDLQSAGNAGEFYTPRAVTDFMVKVVKPQLGEKIADFACGTGGFLTSALSELDKQVGNSLENREIYNKSIYGIEKKALPHMLCVTNMLIHDIDDPNILHGNALEMDYKDLRKMEPFDIILMNPPYGGSEKDSVKVNFPTELRSSETADLFMNVIMYRLKKQGRCAVIIPDGFLFGTDNAKFNIKKKLFSEFNVHTVVRMPHSVFAPYTSIRTNILFFDNTAPTKETWFYRVDMPEGYKNFSKTRPMKLEHLMMPLTGGKIEKKSK
ncbi:class I SAM-dependent DNA methyltransferase [Serpentinicella sp. ANB-PHB4]|uniref:class I SAM-dependent DNA methyltransferase n=1 Tax=Serpentinicella sp. ANB-PHB4 TaxID=3074076 RepID=UPI002856F2FF|nr:class I SAM-dependent DNA methyltransferase [Serpentinicella sp. ANB-PHB4]MDR5658549.1 class I SAM-dependent DNA methyltransferase [Serpentinicella sp. ANB-PHB4]